MKLEVTLALVGGVLAALLASWKQVKKFDVHRTKAKILKLEEDVHDIEGKIKSLTERAIAGDADDAIAHLGELQSKREAANRRIYKLRQRLA